MKPSSPFAIPEELSILTYTNKTYIDCHTKTLVSFLHILGSLRSLAGLIAALITSCYYNNDRRKTALLTNQWF